MTEPKAMEKSENYWALLLVTGIVFVLLAGFDPSLPIPWRGYLNYGFLIVGIIVLIVALEIRRRNKE